MTDTTREDFTNSQRLLRLAEQVGFWQARCFVIGAIALALFLAHVIVFGYMLWVVR